MTTSRPKRTVSPRTLEDRRSPRAVDLNSFVPAMLTNLAQKITTTASAAYRPRFGVGITDWRILSLLAGEPWIAPVRICEATGLDKAAVSRSLHELSKAGLVETLDDGIAQRRLPVALTAKGLEIHDQMVGHSLEREEALLAGFTPQEREQLAGYLRRMRKSVDRM